MSAYRQTLLEAARLSNEIDAVELLVRAALTNNRGFMSIIGDVDHERIAVIEQALARRDDPSSPERARLLGLLSLEKVYGGDLDERLALAHEAVATGRRSGDPAALVDSLRVSAEAIRTLSTLDQRHAWNVEAVELADALGILPLRYWTHNLVMLDALEAGDVEEFRAHLAICRDIAVRVPQATVRWNFTFLSFNDSILRGDLIEADHVAELAREVGDDSGQPDTFGVYGAQLCNLYLHQGRFDELLPLLEQIVLDSSQPVYRAVLAYAHAEAGSRDRATTLLREDRTTGFRMPLDLGWSCGMANWADAAVRAGDRESARVIRDVLGPCQDAIVMSAVTVQPSVSYYVGRLDHLLGDLDAADRHLSAAAALHERMESPLLSAYTDAARAELLADRGNGDDHGRARTLAQRALAAATAGGYGYIERDARDVLERLGTA
jgi:ATP/maltotriose-dependent transcriptional regulator MalT